MDFRGLEDWRRVGGLEKDWRTMEKDWRRIGGLLRRIEEDVRRFSLIFVQVRKVAENREKQLFTFFAFLPPYIGVSGSPMCLKR